MEAKSKLLLGSPRLGFQVNLQSNRLYPWLFRAQKEFRVAQNCNVARLNLIGILG